MKSLFGKTKAQLIRTLLRFKLYIKTNVTLLALFVFVGLSALIAYSTFEVNYNNYLYQNKIHAQTATGQLIFQKDINNYDGAIDATLDSQVSTTNLGKLSSLYVHGRNIKGSVIRFDLSDLSVKSNVLRAYLELYLISKNGNSNPNPLNIFELNRYFKEYETTWVNSMNASPWAIAGANKTGEDIQSSYIAQATVDKEKQWYSFDVTDTVNRWTMSPSTNYGFALKGDGFSDTEYVFASSDNPILEFHPRLKVIALSEIEPTPIPNIEEIKTEIIPTKSFIQSKTTTQDNKPRQRLVVPFISQLQEFFYRLNTYNKKVENVEDLMRK